MVDNAIGYSAFVQMAPCKKEYKVSVYPKKTQRPIVPSLCLFHLTTTRLAEQGGRTGYEY